MELMREIDFGDDVAEFHLCDKNLLSENVELWKERYIKKVESEKRSLKSIKTYEFAIDTFVEFCRKYDKKVSMQELTARFLNRYIMWYQLKIAENDHAKRKLKKRDYELLKEEWNNRNLGLNDSNFTILEKYENTLSHRQNVLKMFMKYITQSNRELHDYTKLFPQLSKITIKEKMTKYLSPNELSKVIIEMMEWPNTYKSYGRKPKSSEAVAHRDSFLMLLYCLTGARTEEIVLVKLSDIDELKTKYVVRIMNGKGGKRRIVEVPKKYIKKHHDYLVNAINDKDYYFSAPYDRKTKTFKETSLDPNRIRRFANFIFQYLGIKKSGLHSVRRGFATKKILEDGMDISTVAKILGNTVDIVDKHYFKYARIENE